MNDRYVAIAPWVVLGLVWAIAAPFATKTVQRESIVSRLSYALPLAFAAWVLYSSAAENALPFLRDSISPENKAVWWAGVILEYGGVGFALWARAQLGKLWSGTITLKEGHHLVQSGPFAITRHPIYTGAVFAAFGAALQDGSVRFLIACALLTAGFTYKLSKEESLLAAQFGDEHRAYRERVKRLIPFVW